MFLLVDHVAVEVASRRRRSLAWAGPYESSGDVWSPFIVDPESAVIDEPGPCSFYNPASREDLKAGALDAIDDLNVDVVRAVAVIDECLFESCVDPGFGQPVRLQRCPVNDVDPAEVVDHAGGDHGTATRRPRVSTRVGMRRMSETGDGRREDWVIRALAGR